jgi:4-hydroxy-2-oxoheptanedioate aldolase
MVHNQTKQRLAEGRLVAGVIDAFPSPDMVEMFGLAGFDFYILDTEHGSIDAGARAHMVRAAEGAGISTICRVPDPTPANICRLLDVGADGIMVPHLCGRADAEAIVGAVKYPPMGDRSLSSTRAVDYGVSMSLAEGARWCNEQTLAVGMIESKEAVQNLEEILGVEGLDVLFIGPIDLSMSLGLPPDPSQPEMKAVIEQIVTQVRAAGKVVGLGGFRTAELYRPFVDMGVRFITINARNLVLNPALNWRRSVAELKVS